MEGAAPVDRTRPRVRRRRPAGIGVGPGGPRGMMDGPLAQDRPVVAPLAQSAERFHGKEKVDSSILSGGSRRRVVPSRSGGPAAVLAA